MSQPDARDSGSPDPSAVRREAEHRLRTEKGQPAPAVPDADARALLHELQVHQIELGMQNEELQRSQLAVEEASERYRGLFDFAPVAYFLWDPKGRILEVNLAGATLLGLNRNMVVRRRFGQFVDLEHRVRFADFCRRVLAADAKETCELKILRGDRAVDVLVEGIATPEQQGKGKVCRAAVVDISQQKRAEELAAANRALESEIAARQVAEEALRKSESTNRALLAAVPDLMFRIRSDGTFLGYTGRTESLYTPAEQFLGKTVEEVLPPAVARLLMASTRAAVASGQVERCEYALDVRGESRWYEARVVVCGRAEVLHIVRDITERKRAEGVLRESHRQNEFLARIVELASQPFAIGYPDGRLGLVNSAFEQLTGYTRDELQAMSWAVDITPPEWREFEQKQLKEQQRSGQPIRYEKEYIRKDGRRVPIELLVHLVCDAAGKPEYYYSFVTDVTERKRAEERTRLLSDVISRLLASDSPQQIVESLCRRVMAHLDCQAFFNFLVDEQAGRLHLNACAGIPADAARQIEWLDYGVAVCGCAARDGCRIVAEQIQTTPDARTDLVRSYGIQAYACHPLLNQGRVVGTLSFGSRTRPTFAEDELALMKDVADHVAIAMQRVSLVESLQRHAQAAEAANIAKSQFLANVSHELRTPMNAIMGMTELALDEELSATLRDYLQTVKQSADGLLELVNQILDLSRIEAGGFQLEAASFDLRKTLEQVVKTLGVRAAEKGLDLACELGDAPTQLIGDSLRLRQVLINLLGNAVKFTVKGRVAVSVTVESSDAGEAVLQFAVSDTGIGIPAADQERIFAPFTQADASTTRQYGGTGLGLTISRRLVELMGGCIWLESQPGQGSTFRFTARFGREGPARCAAAAEAVATRQPAMKTAGLAAIAAKAAGRSLRVLSAEDTAANQKLVSYVLGKRGHRMEIVPDGQQALEAVGREQFDVVLMDVQMPVMDGFLATQAIRQMADRKKARLPIIAMTAHALKGDAERCLEAGMDSYISKPIKAEELIELVERLAEKGRKRTASGRIGKGRKGV